MKWILRFLVGVLLVPGCMFGQQPPAKRPALVNPSLDEKLGGMLSFDVPLIGADSLQKLKNVTIFDARQEPEFAVGHIPGAIQLNPSGPLPSWTDTLDRNQPIVIYCSVGYRSEKVGRRFIEAGFTKVSNLYGSIFDWAERGYPVVDSANRSTDRIHTYNQRWSKLLISPNVEKVW